MRVARRATEADRECQVSISRSPVGGLRGGSGWGVLTRQREGACLEQADAGLWRCWTLPKLPRPLLLSSRCPESTGFGGI